MPKNPNGRTVPVSTSVTAQEKERLQQLAKEQNISVSQLIYNHIAHLLSQEVKNDE